MKNSILLLLLLVLVSSCSSHNPDHPLIMPPKFDVVPKDANDEAKDVLESDEDIEELKDLLLD